MPNGRIQVEHINVLKEVDEWLNIYGETIYNTSGGPITTTNEIASTKSGNTVYFHIFCTKQNI